MRRGVDNRPPLGPSHEAQRHATTRRGALAVVLGLVVAGPLRAHPVHTSDMELRYDAERASVEVALRVWERDLNGALHASGAKALRGRPLLTWLQQSIRFYQDGPIGTGTRSADKTSRRVALADWSWVGDEATPHGQWLYFTVRAPTRALAVQSHLFFGYTKKQLNTVRAGGRSLLFASDDPRTHVARPILWGADAAPAALPSVSGG